MSDSTWWVDERELDDEQNDIVSMPPDGSYLVVGPPGSGKTNLLLLRAAYLARSQRSNLAVLTFTSTLKSFMARGADTYSVPQGTIQTIMKWERDIVTEHSDPIDEANMTFPQVRLAHAKRIETVFDGRPALEHAIDCILVDEIQDCLPEEIRIFQRAAKHVFFVGDAHQQIYERNDLVEELKRTLTTKTLTKHYRNGIQICTVADVIGRNFGMPATLDSCNYDERKNKSSAQFFTHVDAEALLVAMAGRIEQQVKAYPDELIGVVCPNKADVSDVRASLSNMPRLKPHLLPTDDRFFDPLFPDQRVCITTMHSAKGLEFRALHLPLVEHVVKAGKRQQKRLAYTAVTRAKTSLSVYNLKDLPPYLSAARDAVTPRKATPVTVASLLPGKTKK